MDTPVAFFFGHLFDVRRSSIICHAFCTRIIILPSVFLFTVNKVASLELYHQSNLIYSTIRRVAQRIYEYPFNK